MSTGKTWSPEEDERLLRLHADGKTQIAIAQALNRPSSSIPSRLGTLGAKRRRDAAAPTAARIAIRKPDVRACMCCGVRFNSDGPHNRLCNRCRKTDISPYAP